MSNIKKIGGLNEYLLHVENTIKNIKHYDKVVDEAANKISDALKKGNKVIVCGNGGSSADAQHIVAELTGRFLEERKGFSAIALPTSIAAATAISNDYSFEFIFERELQAIGKQGDILIAISTSGNSINVINAVKYAKNNGISTISLLGKDGGKMKDLSDIEIIVPSNETPIIQIVHSIMYHALCDRIDQIMIEK